jgi:UDP-3-O-[3-hydroxymyristoyl] glucosamine N-acyltransferase
LIKNPKLILKNPDLNFKITDIYLVLHKFFCMEFTAQQIADFLKGEIDGDPAIKVNNVSKIEDGVAGTLTFFSNPKYLQFVYTTHASIILVNQDFKPEKNINPTLIRVADAYASFASLLELYNKNQIEKAGQEIYSFVDSTATIGENVYIGSFSYIGENVKIGNNVKIFPQVFLGKNVEIKDNTILYSGVKVYHECKIGANCIIHSGTVIGSDGFGFAPTENNGYKKIPQLGNVILEDDIEIGSNCSIDRATMGSTLLSKGVKLDNLIQIAHNVEVGEDTVIVAQAGVSGSTKLGKNCQIGGQVGIAGHATIADDVKIGAQAGVPSGVKEKGAILLGSPAIPIRDFQKSSAIFKQLPDLSKKVYELERQLNELKKMMGKD